MGKFSARVNSGEDGNCDKASASTPGREFNPFDRKRIIKKVYLDIFHNFDHE
jgi:hypothetical protein